MVLYKKVCQDIVRSLQILPAKSIIYQAYEKAIGKTNMKVISSFKNLPMYNFGVMVTKEMDDVDRAYLEQNIQVSLAQKELDLEDAIAIRNLKDVNQAERLLVVRRKKRIKTLQESAAANSQAQAQANVQSMQAKAQADAQMEQLKAQNEAQLEQLKAQLEAQRMQMRHEMEKELKGMELQMAQMKIQQEQQFRQNLEKSKDDRKDKRVEKQAVEQSKLISQRQGKREELSEREEDILDILTQE
jgi:flagellar biosynthesis GTPase FlhF